jgi:hypothetical protein
MVGKENFVHTLFAAALLSAVAVSGCLSGLTGGRYDPFACLKGREP